MKFNTGNRRTLVRLGLAALTSSALSGTAGAQSFNAQTILKGLNNPRGLAFGPDGGLYVTEAGVGGFGPSFVDGGGATVSYGETSGITRWLNGTSTRLLDNLPSLADRMNGAPGGGAGGLTGITFAPNGTAYGVINFGGEADARTGLLNAGASKAGLLGTVVQFNFTGTPTVTSVADITGYAKANNLQGPTMPGKPPETNPYGITALKNGGVAVTDAGGNFVATTNSANAITGHTLLPNYTNPIFNPQNPGTGGPTYQAVPTGLTEGPDGTLYVAELSGFPFLVGGAHIDIIKNGVLTGRLNGFTNLVGVTYSNGELYALQLNTNGLASPTGPGPGELVEIDPLTGQMTVLYSGLSSPGGLAIGSDGAFYITNNSTAPGGGSVLRLAAVPEPGVITLFFGIISTGICLFRKRRK